MRFTTPRYVSPASILTRRRISADRLIIVVLVVVLLLVSLRPALPSNRSASLQTQQSPFLPHAEAPIPKGVVGVVGAHNSGNNNNHNRILTEEEATLQQQIRARHILSQLRNGIDFFADYDILKVRGPESYRTVGGVEGGTGTAPTDKPLRFRYMNETTSKFPIRWVSTKPRIAFVPSFLTDEECDAIIGAALPSMARSQVAEDKVAGGRSRVDRVRTSSQSWLSVTDGIGKTIAERIYELTSFPVGSSELLQVLRYEYDQKYDAHLDYFDPVRYGPQPSNRAMTVYLYLSDVEEGGHTWFPNADGNTSPLFNMMECQRGFGMKPKKGSVVVFYDMTPEGEYDPLSMHGSCPVKKGVKFGGTLWFRIPTS